MSSINAYPRLTGYNEETLQRLADVNRGAPGANMTTLGLEVGVTNRNVYQLNPTGLQEVDDLNPIDLEVRASNPAQILKPAYLEIRAIWDKTPYFGGDGNNILGDNGRLTLGQRTIEVPVNPAQDPLLAYFGATLIKPEETIRFPDEAFPIWKMNVGERYVPDFLMSERGGGYYLEYHEDQPHFHMPIEGGGAYLLGKWNEEQTHLQLAGFEIPDQHAVYTKKGAIHCDAGLTGDLLVGYTEAHDCSTVLLRDREENFVHINFI